MDKDKTVLEMNVELQRIINDYDRRLNSFYDKCVGGDKKVPPLPPYESLKSYKTRYELQRSFSGFLDEAIELKVRCAILLKSLDEYSRVTAVSKADYSAVVDFKESVRKHIEYLTNTRYDLMDICKNLNNRIAILGSYNFNEV